MSLAPDTPYNLTGMVRGAYLTGGGTGANVCVVGTWDHSDAAGSLGTFDWRRVDVTFVSDATGTARVGARMGFYGSVVSGTLWIDDLVLSSDDFAPVLEGQHVRLALERSDLASIAPAHLVRWQDHLDDAWEQYAVLVGGQSPSPAPRS